MAKDSDSWYWEKTWSDFRRGHSEISLTWNHGMARARLYDEGVPQMRIPTHSGH